MSVKKVDCPKYITLLGRRYPVIQCKRATDLAVNLEPESLITVENLPPAESEQPSTSGLGDSPTVIDDGHSSVTTLQNIALASPSLLQQLPSLKSLAEAVVNNMTSNEAGQSANSDLNTDDSLSERSVELDGNREVVSMEEAVSLALSLNEPVASNFDYEVNESPSVSTTNSSNIPEEIQQMEPGQEVITEESEDVAEASERPGDHSAESVGKENDSDSNGDRETSQSTDIGTSTSLDETADLPIALDDSLAAEASMIDDASDENPNSIVSVSKKLDILEYAQSEWKGTTFTANCLRNGYQQLISGTGCAFLRRIRGDNYCALRATAFQILSQNLKVFEGNLDWKEHVQGLVDRLLHTFQCHWLSRWSFAGRLPHQQDTAIAVMRDCINFFCEQKQLSETFTDDDERQTHFLTLFNSKSNAEIKIFEALKLIMLHSAVELHDLQENGDDVPVFAWLLFARDTSEDPLSFMLNHLNHAGDSGGLEQVEMCLLGHSLQVTLRVFRPSNVEQEDFTSFYPDHMVDAWDRVDLIAEDDRHYNILVR